MVNEALALKTAPPDKDKLKLAVETFKLAKEKYKPASVCYCVYAVLLELQSIEYLDDSAVKRLKELLETAMSSLPENMGETVKPAFLEILALIQKENVKVDADLFKKLNKCINEIDYIALREHFNATSEKLILYLKEPFSPDVSYRSWMISVAFDDPEKIKGKLTIKAGDRVIFDDYLYNRQSLEIPYKPDEKDDTLTFITANQKSVSRQIYFHEKIRTDRDFIKVYYMEHDCKRSIYNNHFRVAIVQLKYDLIHESNVIKIKHEKHDDRYFKKVTSILKAVIGKADLVVFPEFSIPFDYLAELKEHAEKSNIIIVAGSHYVTSDNLNKYQDLFNDRIGEDDIRKNISPVIIPGSKILHTEKVLGAKIERPLFDDVGMTNGTLNRIFRLGNNVSFGVMVCFDFLNDELRQRISDACKVILIPQTNPVPERFHEVGKIELVNPRSSGNKAYIMASGIFTFKGGSEIEGGDSGVFLTLDKDSYKIREHSIIKPIDGIKEQFIQIADLNTDFYSARDIQTAQVAIRTQLIHIFEELEILKSGEENLGAKAFLKALDGIESLKESNEIIKLLRDNDAVIKNHSPLMHSNISGNKLDNLKFEEIKDRCRAVVIK